jgi:CubicO group peptidase (beta-lactamase class C family)
VQAVYSDLGYIVLGAVLEAAGGLPLSRLFERTVAGPLHLAARYATTLVEGAVATELDERGLVCGQVHDENAYEGGGMFGHAGLFASLDDVAKFAAAIVMPGSAFSPDRFFTEAPVPGASWRLGWDTPSHTPGVSAAGDRWPREHAVGHMGFTGTSIWLDLAHRRWVVLLTNRVHPTRFAGTADRIKSLRRSVHDAVVDALGDA